MTALGQAFNQHRELDDLVGVIHRAGFALNLPASTMTARDLLDAILGMAEKWRVVEEESAEDIEELNAAINDLVRQRRERLQAEVAGLQHLLQQS